MRRCVEVMTKRKPADREWVPRETRTLDLLEGFSPDSARIELDGYRGRLDRKAEARGFFRALEKDGRWWLVDPDGHLLVHVGVCATSLRKSEIAQKTAKERFGAEESWAEFASELIARHGFNGTGGWSADALLRKTSHAPVYTPSWNFMGEFGNSKGLTRQLPGHLGYPDDCMPVFHPEFEGFCDEYAARLAATKDDPRLLGHFSDNELPAPADLLDRSLVLEARYAREAALKWLAERRGTAPEEVNAGDVTDADRDAFRGHVFDTYFRITTGAIRSHDANHLCLGPRLHGASLRSPEIFRAAGRHLDVIAVNYYGAWGPDPDRMAMWTKESARPVMITEFYAKGGDSGLANTAGAGWLVKTQADRATFYQHFTLGLLESKTCVGWHWFKYSDNNPEDVTTDPSNRDSNKGIVTSRHEPYETLLAGMNELNREVYALVDHFDRR